MKALKMNIISDRIIEIFLPNLSEIGPINMAPTAAPITASETKVYF